MIEQSKIHEIKGVGEKTEKLFAKVGIYNLQQLLHYYPRDYDCYAEPVPLRECRQEEKNAVYGRIVHSPSVKGNQRKRRCPGTLRGAGAAAAYLV